MRPTVPLILGCGVASFGALAPQSRPPLPEQLEQSFTRQGRPIVEKYCVGCHSGSSPSGGYDLEKASTAGSLAIDLERAEKTVLFLRTRHMPPPSGLQPSPDERKVLADLIDRIVVERSRTADPGKVTVRRLNRLEYNNSVRDVLGVDLDLSADFPNDDVGYGFDNIGDLLTVSPLLAEKYLLAAERAAAAAVPAPRPQVTRYDGTNLAKPERSYVNEESELMLYANDTVIAPHEFPAAGEYRIKLRMWGMQVPGGPVQVKVRIAGKDMGTVDVPNVRTKPLDIEFVEQIGKGRATVEVDFFNDFYQPANPDPTQRDRNFTLSYIEIEAPKSATNANTAVRQALFEGLTVPGNELATASAVFVRVAERAWRREPTKSEADRLLLVYKGTRERGGGFEEGVQAGIAAVLTSPHFLFRVERRPGADGLLGQIETATRLSFFIWASVPDAELRSLAKQGKLHDTAVLEAQVDRMLRDPKSEALVDGFASQWLLLGKLKELDKDEGQFPWFTKELQVSMVEESRRFFQSVMKEDRAVTMFIDADYTFVDDRLAELYGMKPVGAGWHRVTVDRNQRGGVLGQASFLTVTSNPNRTSPVKRGKYILEQLLGTPLPPPPPDVGVIAEDGPTPMQETLRMRLERHRKDVACASCHNAMDPLGFALEKYDGTGKLRSGDEGRAIDTSGRLPDGTSLDGFSSLKKSILNQKEEFLRNFTARLSTYATGRGPRAEDRWFTDRAVALAEKNGGSFSDYVKAVVLSDPFRKAPREN